MVDRANTALTLATEVRHVGVEVSLFNKELERGSENAFPRGYTLRSRSLLSVSEDTLTNRRGSLGGCIGNWGISQFGSLRGGTRVVSEGPARA